MHLQYFDANTPVSSMFLFAGLPQEANNATKMANLMLEKIINNDSYPDCTFLTIRLKEGNCLNYLQ
jgi:hypothetical protein